MVLWLGLGALQIHIEFWWIKLPKMVSRIEDEFEG
jgi:hypothetical protein